ncbi:MAG: sensor domain-containing diguanylate cyclase [Gammaproteobacteria bacterium]|nr:sensor domain-containing diguanylate cyclase [Gammaproteobacteria bacterium]
MNFKFNSKQGVYVSFSLVIFLILLSVFFTLVQSSRMEKNMQIMVDNHNTKNILLSEMIFHASQRTLLLQSITLNNDPFKRDELYLKLREHGGQFLNSRQKLMLLSMDEKEKTYLKQQRQFSLFTASEQNKAAQLLLEGKDQQAKPFIFSTISSQEKVLHTLKNISLYLNKKNRHSHHDSANDLRNTKIIIIFLTSSVVLFLLTIAGFVYRNIQRHVKELNLSYSKVKNSEVRERSIRDMMVDSIIIIDHKGIIKEFNKSAEKNFGYSGHEIIGKNVDLLMTSADKNQHDQYIDNYLQTGRTKIIGVGREIIAKRKDNTSFFADLSISKLDSDKNGPPLFIGTLHDVSARKENELQLLQRQNDLEHRVKLRTEELANANILLTQQANFDALTGLANRYLFFDRLRQAIAQAKRRNYSLAILFIDLDGFKNVNDSYGHDIGDEVLKKIAIRLEQHLRDEDTASRLGGDEFAIILNSVTDVKFINMVTEKMLNAINQPLNITDNNILMSTSIGISIYPENNTDPDILLKQADIAMYKSKDKGKNTFSFFENNTDLD